MPSGIALEGRALPDLPRAAPARREVLAAGAAAALAGPALAASPRFDWPIVELRQYTLRGGRRDELVTLFEREFIETQDAAGAHVLATFRDLDDPDRFVWMRGFESMAARAQALQAFYGGPVWKAHRNAANATILDSDNVLLLHPARPDASFQGRAGSGEVLAFIHYLDDATTAPFAAFFERVMRPGVQAAGGRVLGAFATETSPNSFPQLPVREKDRVFVWFAKPGPGGEAGFLAAWRRRSGWRDVAGEPLLPAFMRKPEMLRLMPTPRSPLA
jgi:quinol monooxygenase YgiN